MCIGKVKKGKCTHDEGEEIVRHASYPWVSKTRGCKISCIASKTKKGGTKQNEKKGIEREKASKGTCCETVQLKEGAKKRQKRAP